jgi:hypothetical protein
MQLTLQRRIFDVSTGLSLQHMLVHFFKAIFQLSIIILTISSSPTYPCLSLHLSHSLLFPCSPPFCPPLFHSPTPFVFPFCILTRLFVYIYNQWKYLICCQNVGVSQRVPRETFESHYKHMQKLSRLSKGFSKDSWRLEAFLYWWVSTIVINPYIEDTGKHKFGSTNLIFKSTITS